MKNPSPSPHTGGITHSSKLTEQLLIELKRGKYATYTTLPSEMELAEEYKVSRTVIRDVLSNLEHEGFIARYRGIGTIIQRDIVNLNNRMDLKLEYYELIRSMGAEPSSDMVTLTEIPATDFFAEQLTVPPQTPLLVCTKRVLADEIPVLYSSDTFPKDLISQKDSHWIDWSEPIFDIFERESHIIIDTDIATFKAVNANQEIQEKLQVSSQAPLIQIEEIGYHKMNIPILHTIAYYTDFFEFTTLRKKF